MEQLHALPVLHQCGHKAGLDGQVQQAARQLIVALIECEGKLIVLHHRTHTMSMHNFKEMQETGCT